MPLNKLENFIKNYEGRILYVNSNDLDATDSITNQGNSLTKPFKTIQRALIEASRFSFLVGNNNDNNARTTILVFPGDHTIDNRPGYGIRQTGTALAEAVAPNGNTTSPASDEFTLNLESNFDITQEDNILYKFNSVEGGVIIPRGTSIVGLDLRKTRIRPKYVPNPTDPDVPNTAIFRVTGLCYFWQFSFFDGDESGLVYTNNQVFTSGSGNQSVPTFSHHKLTCFEYADGVNVPSGYNETDLDMYMQNCPMPSTKVLVDRFLQHRNSHLHLMLSLKKDQNGRLLVHLLLILSLFLILHLVMEQHLLQQLQLPL